MPAEPLNPPLLVDEREARRLLGGISRATLFNYRRAGLPFIRLPGRIMFSPADLADWISRHRVASATENAPPTRRNGCSDGGNGHSSIPWTTRIGVMT